ncbi:hypothetical protein OMP38_03105 [Cohnella ginsengisoli]|uniref:GIY-YIG domain-containing protein n=1 Tax=Cohnella ginsengisoli TaxID=425004 RepID=A0A9X4QL99_9BACL|nr:hypothetical protein [Cohnella ginsengisoli]MDG0789951.1 hypothetical protein [Cohnella ginsengisoli]
MTTHFGIKLRNKEGGHKLTIDNYIGVRPKDITSYSFDELEEKKGRILNKFELNMKYFESLSRIEFNDELTKLVASDNFIEIIDLNSIYDVPGYYIMVLDDYCQIYIGIAHNIKSRIMQHWRDKVPLDNLVNSSDSGLLHIDSFRALDTTRIYACIGYEDNFSEDHMENMIRENLFIFKFPVDYCLNVATLFLG